jgi:beta-glucosidase
VHRFVEYACGISRRMGDRVSAITTHNEPWVIAVLGHENGVFAPGLKDRALAMQVSHHLLLSHGRAMQAMRSQGCRSRLGIVLNLAPVQPATDSDADRAQARLEDGRLLRWYMDALFKAEYPQDVLEFLGLDAPRVEAGDLREIATPMDFLGVNYYSRTVVSATGAWDVHRGGREITDMGGEVYPEGLTELLLRLNRDYPVPPLFVAENGAAFGDEVVDGRVHDHRRTDYIARHIAAVGEAIRLGVPMEGYSVWSLLDNFEWTSGYSKRFGIVHVDYETQRRTLKDSALWYREFLRRVKASRAGLASTPLEA